MEIFFWWGVTNLFQQRWLRSHWDCILYKLFSKTCWHLDSTYQSAEMCSSNILSWKPRCNITKWVTLIGFPCRFGNVNHTLLSRLMCIKKCCTQLKRCYSMVYHWLLSNETSEMTIFGLRLAIAEAIYNRLIFLLCQLRI